MRPMAFLLLFAYALIGFQAQVVELINVFAAELSLDRRIDPLARALHYLLRVWPSACRVRIIAGPHVVIFAENRRSQSGGAIVQKRKPKITVKIFTRRQLQLHVFTNGVTMSCLLRTILVIHLLDYHSQPSRIKFRT